MAILRDARLRRAPQDEAVCAARPCITAPADATHLASRANLPISRASGVRQTGLMMSVAEKVEAEAGRDFIRDIVADDLASGRHKTVVTRFPPEPNGYLHIGHAKSICLNFGIAEEYGGTCNLRYDDTNPEKEEEEYVKSIADDVRWLGFTPANTVWASDYFDTMYEYALDLINKGFAYVDDQTAEQIRLSRGTLTSAGKDSPFRNRSV